MSKAFTRLDPIIEMKLISILKEEYIDIPFTPIDMVNRFKELHGITITTRAVGRVMGRENSRQTHYPKQQNGVSWYIPR